MRASTEQLRGAGNCATSHLRPADENAFFKSGHGPQAESGFRGAGNCAAGHARPGRGRDPPEGFGEGWGGG
ncbi:hypothetical protein DWB77_03445 [Streptomyces hundungensis]|uniref:Uncharacterized protein n=1 Tax=Streptomyces hundungensis TaxID=1077946 RepID=A0A387HCT9_9ACTN|nr:hypothetical protein DWB77_03445 [Streptomyces hundungensis]